MSVMRPCPRHPEHGEVMWLPVTVTHPITREKREDEMNLCVACLVGMKPAGPAEFAS